MRRLISIFIVSSLLSMTPVYGQTSKKGKDVKILYILSDFKDKRIGLSDENWTKHLQKLNQRLDAYWRVHSYQSIRSIQGTWTKRFTMPEKSTAYMNVQKVRTVQRTLAKKAGFHPRQYDHVVYCYPSIKHSISFGALGSPGNIWLPGQNPFDGGLIHEFGHAMGVGHSQAIEGRGKVVYPGQLREGRDGLYMMGSDGGGRIGDFSTINLPMRWMMGFVDAQKYAPQVQKSGVFRIWDHELLKLPSPRHLGLRLDVQGKDFWVTFAPKMVKRWAKFQSQGFARGVIVHQVEGRRTHLLDFTPGSFSGTKNEEDYKDTRDGALQIGKSFQFPKSAVQLRPLRVGEKGGLKYIDIEIKVPESTGPFRDRDSYKYQLGSYKTKAVKGFQLLTPESAKGLCYWHSPESLMVKAERSGDTSLQSLKKQKLIHKLKNGYWELTFSFPKSCSQKNVRIQSESLLEAWDDRKERRRCLVRVSKGRLELTIKSVDGKRPWALSKLHLEKKKFW